MMTDLKSSNISPTTTVNAALNSISSENQPKMSIPIMSSSSDSKSISANETYTTPIITINSLKPPAAAAPLTGKSIPVVSLKSTVTTKQLSDNNNNNTVNNYESDLTELSWLTNPSMQIFSKTSINQSPTQPAIATSTNFNLTGTIIGQQQYSTKRLPAPSSIKNKSSTVTVNRNLPSIKLLKNRHQNIINVEAVDLSPATKKNQLLHLSLSRSSDICSGSDALARPSQQQHHSCPKSPLSTSSSPSISSPSLSPSSNASLVSQSRSSTSSSSSSSAQSSVAAKMANLSQSITMINQASAENSLSNIMGAKYKNTCGLNKPTLTLSCLIFMAIEESTEKCLPVRDIYEWIQTNFPFYRLVSNPGWKSSVRHNLSFSKCFRKMDRVGSAASRLTTADPGDDVNRKRRHEQNQQQVHGMGTCWEVNKECRLYLAQTLKKSSFWFHNSQTYPYLADQMEANLTQCGEEGVRENRIKSQHHRYHQSRNAEILENLKENRKVMNEKMSGGALEQNSSDNDNEEMDENDDGYLFEFVQKEQRNLLENNEFIEAIENENEKENEKNKGEQSEDQQQQALIDEIERNAIASFLRSSFSPRDSNNSSARLEELSLSSSTSSLSSAFALLSASLSKTKAAPFNSKPSSIGSCKKEKVGKQLLCKPKRRKTVEAAEISRNKNNEIDVADEMNKEESEDSNNSELVNSDLEMEVASTLVGMKFFTTLKK